MWECPVLGMMESDQAVTGLAITGLAISCCMMCEGGR